MVKTGVYRDSEVLLSFHQSRHLSFLFCVYPLSFADSPANKIKMNIKTLTVDSVYASGAFIFLLRSFMHPALWGRIDSGTTSIPSAYPKPCPKDKGVSCARAPYAEHAEQRQRLQTILYRRHLVALWAWNWWWLCLRCCFGLILPEWNGCYYSVTVVVARRARIVYPLNPKICGFLQTPDGLDYSSSLEFGTSFFHAG